MGFLDYAWSVFFDKDYLKTKLLISSNATFPQLLRDDSGFVSIFPEPKTKETEGEKLLSLMGYDFQDDAQGKRQLASLFRASVFHLGSHVFCSAFDDYEEWRKGKNAELARFTTFLIEDVKANSFVASRYPEKLADLTLANTLALKRLHRLDKVINPATKCMAELLIRSNTGTVHIKSGVEHDIVDNLAQLLEHFRAKTFLSFKDPNDNLTAERLKLADDIYYAIEDLGPITEVPFLPHTEELGKCGIFHSSCLVDFNVFLDSNFRKCLDFLGGIFPYSESSLEAWQRSAETEASQVLDSWRLQKEKDQKILEKYRPFVLSTGFASVEIPPQDYTEFLRIKARCRSEAHRLIETLLVARDALDEDPRKNYGVLDLQEMIQVIASKSPRMDVFMLDENLSKSYSWIILLDVSRSMRYVKDFALEVLTILGDAASELLMDPASWAMYAFSDRFFVIKDPKERYNVRVKSRIGGIKFDGPTLLSDALMVAGQVIKNRSENMRLITVVSDGYQYNYSSLKDSLSETVKMLERKSVSLIGVGTKSRQMEQLFKSSFTVYSLRDLAKKFSSLYLSASMIAAES